MYFDTPKYATSGKHNYPKLMPEAARDFELLADGEGVFDIDDGNGGA